MSAETHFDKVAQRILAAHPAPDLRGITILLPNMHAAQPLARALVRNAGVPALLLPQMTTLDVLAQSVPLDAPVTPESQRSAMLYQQLRERRWFDNADLWGMTRELLKLFDQLTLSLHALPDDADAFAAAVQRAYEARQNEALQLEARLVFELWHAMQQGAELDAARAYQQRLAKLAQQASRPLYVLRASEWDAVEQRFLEEYEQHAVVKVFDLREMGGSIHLPLALSSAQSAEYRRDERQALTANGGLKFFAATSLEQEARAAAMQVRLWLQQGKKDIAIVAQDRVTARRLRALLERAEVLVADESGWTFATLSVSTVLDRWITALQSDFYHHDLLDLLKSPFIFADMTAGERKNLVYQLEQLLRRHGVVSGLQAFVQLVGDDAELQGALARLQQAAGLVDQNKRRTLGEWLAALHASLDVLGISRGLQQDEAGQQLLRALDNWQRELAQDDGRYRFHEWRRWLAQQLDGEMFHDTGIDSPVCFTHLAATRWRVFDAVLLLGCDADHLPSVTDGGTFFNDAVRAALGLPTRGFHAVRQRDDLHGLLALNDCVLTTWQKDKGGEQGLLSPYLQLLREGRCEATGHPPAYPLRVLRDEAEQTQREEKKQAVRAELVEARESVHISTSSMRTDSGIGAIDEPALLALLASEDARTVDLPCSSQPAPRVATDAVPQRVSISAYNSLVACPYQFHARHILKLNELDEVQEVIEKRDYGERVHEVLQRFHERYPQVAGAPREEMETALRGISTDVFADLLAQDFVARAWLVRWHASLPAYLEWQAENEAQGWRYAGAEQKFEVALEGVQLAGRIDRLDVKHEDSVRGECLPFDPSIHRAAHGTQDEREMYRTMDGVLKKVLDYKTQNDQLLRNKLREAGEDVQLSCYAYAEDAQEAAFVSIENGKVKSVAPPHGVGELARLNAERLQQVMGEIRSGAGLVANGINATCAYCEMRGVCRKGEWVNS